MAWTNAGRSGGLNSRPARDQDVTFRLFGRSTGAFRCCTSTPRYAHRLLPIFISPSACLAAPCRAPHHPHLHRVYSRTRLPRHHHVTTLHPTTYLPTCHHTTTASLSTYTCYAHLPAPACPCSRFLVSPPSYLAPYLPYSAISLDADSRAVNTVRVAAPAYA